MAEIEVIAFVAVIAISTVSHLFPMGRSYFQSVKHHSYSHRNGRKIFGEMKSTIIEKMDLSSFQNESNVKVKLQNGTSHLSLCNYFFFFSSMSLLFHCFSPTLTQSTCTYLLTPNSLIQQLFLFPH